MLKVFIVLLTILTQACLTIPGDRSQNAIEAKGRLRRGHGPRVAVDFSLESVDWLGNRTIFSKEQSKTLADDWIPVFEEAGFIIDQSKPDLRIRAKLEIIDDGCSIAFIKSNCVTAMVLNAGSLYLIPAKFDAKFLVTTIFESDGKSPVKIVDSSSTSTWFHLALVPAIPYELLVMPNREVQKDVYRSILAKYLREHMSTNGDS